MSVVKPYPKGDEKGWPGWKFPESDTEYPNATIDHLFGSKYLHEVYFKDDKEYKGRYSVPLIWDKKANAAVSSVSFHIWYISLQLVTLLQESAEMLRWLPTAFDSSISKDPSNIDLYPPKHQDTIDRITEWMQRDLNLGVYKAGFAPNQEVYDKNVIPVFGALNKIEELLAANGGPFLLGKDMTELDIRLYSTIIRFDTVYVQHFKCNLGTIRHDYPQINNWLKHLYWKIPGFKETTDFKHIKENYTKSHYDINPKAITPKGPYPDVEDGYELDLSQVRVGGVKMPEVVEYQKSLD